MLFKPSLCRYPPLVTVFSAPNYCDMYQNKSSFVTIGAREGLTYQQLHWADHPFCLPNFQNAVQFSLPFLITHMSSMIIGLLKQVRADLDTPAQSKVDAQISKMEKWHTLSRHVREERQALFQVRSDVAVCGRCSLHSSKGASLALRGRIARRNVSPCFGDGRVHRNVEPQDGQEDARHCAPQINLFLTCVLVEDGVAPS